MAETKLRERAVIEKLNSMAVDVISVALTTDAETIADNRLISRAIEIPNAVAVTGGTAIIQSMVLFNWDDSVESPAMEIIVADSSTQLGSDEGSELNVADGNTYPSLQGSFTVSNWSTLATDTNSNEMATKTNIGLAVKAASDSRSIFLHVVNRSGGDYTPSATTALKAKIGIVKD